MKKNKTKKVSLKKKKTISKRNKTVGFTLKDIFKNPSNLLSDEEFWDN